MHAQAAEEPGAHAASSPSEGIMAIYHQFRHLWSRSATHMASAGRSHFSRHPQHAPAAPPAQVLHMQSEPLPILLPIFGLTAAAA